MKGGRRRPKSLALSSILAICACWLMAPAANAAFEFVRPFGSDGTSTAGFSSPGPVAIDHGDGVAYVLDRQAGALFKFDLDGNPIDFGGSGPNINGNELSGLSTAGNPGTRQVAVNSATHIVYLTGNASENVAHAVQAFHSNGEPAEFTSGPGANTNEISGLPDVRGVAVDSSGAIYVSGTKPGITSDEVSVYSPSGALLLPDLGVDIQAPGNLAVASDGVLYVMKNALEVTEYIPSEFPVTPFTTYKAAPELLDPNQARSVAVDPLTDWVYVLEAFFEEGTEVNRVAVYDDEGGLIETFGGEGEPGELERPDGIAVGGDGEIRTAFVSHEREGEPAQVEIFREEICEGCPPTIESEAATSVTGDSAILRARINANGSDSTYWFEYGLADCAGGGCTQIPIEPVDFGSRRKGTVVTQAIAGLKAGTLYHFRVAAENEFGPEFGVDKTFTTQSAGLGVSLSDLRVWEMVSPPKKTGGTIIRGPDTATQAAASGDGLVYASLGPIVQGANGSQLPSPSTVIARRNDGGQWVSEDLTPSHTFGSAIRFYSEFKLFSPDLTVGEVEPADATLLSPEATEQTPYLWNSSGAPQFTPLVTAANVPPGTEFGLDPNSKGVVVPVRIEGATSDLGHVVIGSEKAGLVQDAERESVYMWSGGDLRAISELPNGDVVNGILGSGRGSVRHAISDDASRVFWAPTHNYLANGINLPALYLRDMVAGASFRLDVPQSGANEEGAEKPAFSVASSDGSVVFFTDTQHLTPDASPTGRDLYRCEIGPVEGGLGCAELTNISVAVGEAGEAAEVLDQVSAASEDGTRLYFVARGVLDENANNEGAVAQTGEPNLYFWEEGQGTEFIATLSENDYMVWGAAATLPLGFANRISAMASPGGRYFAFTSERSLTGNDNRNESNAVNTEVFLFDAGSSASRLSCVSCNPTGAAAVGEKVPKRSFAPADPGAFWVGRWVAANLPQATHTQPEGRSLYRPRTVLDNGRVFFNSVDPLVPADSNQRWDVYQHEPLGVGGCTTGIGTAVTVRSGAGCVGLLSAGTSEDDAGFLDASASGDDVFFLTRSRLSALDQDEEMDVYDARVNGVAAVVDPVSGCVGEACQPVVGPPNDPTPASESFQGNTRQQTKCKKGQRKVRRKGKVVCVRKKSHPRKNGKKHKTRSARNGRGVL